eukprot:364283-Chlamydomonas_euryale.AAC.13
MWGDCPLASLCNYQTYVLFVLPRLASLDTLLLADETKQLAEATFLKKQMYYNMRSVVRGVRGGGGACEGCLVVWRVSLLALAQTRAGRGLEKVGLRRRPRAQAWHPSQGPLPLACLLAAEQREVGLWA